MTIPERYDMLIETLPDIKRKGKNNPYTSDNGYMCTFITKQGTLAVRLPKDDIKKYLEMGCKEVRQYNTLMKDFVEIPEEWWLDDTKILNLIEYAHQRVFDLKPK